jgi:4,5-DOPA dioxygenase extradiol
MNALEDNAHTRVWEALGRSIGKPAAILVVSAHWQTAGTAVTAMDVPRTIHDFGGFPQALFDMQYPAPGDSRLAARVRDLLAPIDVRLDHEWGLDHGTWSVLHKMYPEADVPVLQLSLDNSATPREHLALGSRLAALRDEGVLLIATGNVVHNLGLIRWGAAEPYPWAQRFNARVRACLLAGDAEALADYESWGAEVPLAVPTAEHFLPLLYIVGARCDDEQVTIAADGIEHGSISMLSAAVGKVDPAQ